MDALVDGLAILAAPWSAWVAYTWLGNTAGSDEGVMRVALLAAMGAMVVVSLAVPHAFGRDALLFGLAYTDVRALHLVAYSILARGDPALPRVVLRLTSTITPAASMLVLAGVLHGTGRALSWVAALIIGYGGLMLRGRGGASSRGTSPIATAQ